MCLCRATAAPVPQNGPQAWSPSVDPWQSSPGTVPGHSTPVWTRGTAPGHCTPLWAPGTVPHSDPPAPSPKTLPRTLGSAAASELSPKLGWDAAHWPWQGAPAPILAHIPVLAAPPPTPISQRDPAVIAKQAGRGGSRDCAARTALGCIWQSDAGGTGHKAGVRARPGAPDPCTPSAPTPVCSLCHVPAAPVWRGLHKGTQGPRARRGLAGR